MSFLDIHTAAHSDTMDLNALKMYIKKIQELHLLPNVMSRPDTNFH